MKKKDIVATAIGVFVVALAFTSVIIVPGLGMKLMQGSRAEGTLGDELIENILSGNATTDGQSNLESDSQTSDKDTTKMTTEELMTSELTTSELTTQEPTTEKVVIYKEVNDTVWVNEPVNQRSGPSEKYDIVATAEMNESFIRTGIGSNGWWRLKRLDGTIVYSFGSHYRLIAELPTEPEITTEVIQIPNKTNIVSVNTQEYYYEDMVEDLKQLANAFADKIHIKTIGTTADNREIYCAVIGDENAKNAVIIDAALHGREYVASIVSMYTLEYTLNNWDNEAFNDTAIYYIPMINPDGVSISQMGLKGIRNVELRKEIAKIGCTNYSRWKSNANGIDLNRQFSYGWGGKETEYNSPSSEGFKGYAAETELEVQAILNLTNSLKGRLCGYIGLHASGNIIYWNCGQTGKIKENILNLANAVRNTNGCVLESTYTTNYGLSTDYFIWSQNVPAITVELGNDICPVPQNKYASIIKKNRMLFINIADLF